jgi:hypothetical protein
MNVLYLLLFLLLAGCSSGPPKYSAVSTSASGNGAHFSVPRPDVRPGDRWTYTYVDKISNRVLETFVHVVRSVSDQDITVEATSSTGAPPSTLVFSLEWSLRAGYQDSKFSVRPYFDFPLESGQSWRSRYTTFGSDGQTDNDMKCKAVLIENIVVSAGVFEAVKLVCDTDVSYRGAFRGSYTSRTIRESIWYAPSAKRFVRWDWEYFGRGAPPSTVMELKQVSVE